MYPDLGGSGAFLTLGSGIWDGKKVNTVLTDKELDGIGPVQTVGAVGPDDPGLELVNCAYLQKAGRHWSCLDSRHSWT